MSTFLDRFLPDPEFADSRWIFETAKPIFVNWIVEFAPYDPQFHKLKLGKRKPYLLDPSCPSAHIAYDQVTVVIFERDEAASEVQQNGWEFILANAAPIEPALTKKLLSIHTKNLAQFLDEEMPGDPSLRKHWEQIQQIIPNPETAIERFFKLVGISLATTGLDECCFVGFEFQTGWDLDHGLEIVMHKDRVLAAAGLTELMAPYGSIVDKIKAIQQYELDSDDFEIE